MRRTLIVAAFLMIASGIGCAGNVDEFEFQKWGHSYVPRLSSMDTSTQGGAAQNGAIPKAGKKTMPSAAVGGGYQRSLATSPNYRLTGGFQVAPSNQ